MYDVAIIGAGPAGLATALSLSAYLKRESIEFPKVIVMDKESHPGKNKPCGGMILKPLINLFPKLSRIASRKIRGLRITYRANSYDIRFNEIVALNVDREKLSEYFMSLVDNRVEMVLGERIRGISKEGSIFKIYTENNKILARYLVGADGVNSIVRRTFFTNSFNPSKIGLTYQIWCEINKGYIDRELSDYNEFYYGREFSPGGYAWIFPYDEIIKVGVGAIASHVKKSLNTYISYLIEYRGIKCNKVIKKESYPVPLSGGLKKIVTRGIALVGDAAHQVEPISGAGIHLAALNGLILGKCIADALLKRNNKSILLKNYERIWNRVFRKELLRQGILVKMLLSFGSKVTSGKLDKDTIKEFAKLILGMASSSSLVKVWLKSRLINR